MPGDMILVGPGSYKEMLLMWKPVRCRAWGAPSVIVNANTHPSGKMDAWRAQDGLPCSGVSLDGGLITQATRSIPPARARTPARPRCSVRWTRSV
ncbi:hypothetical protein ACFOPS_04685 [Ralstonia solanacearum]|uniref:hypothetical protein n=1 Tax=Ralstonia solanacearum TaxID=305 RepID=UPI00361DCA97